MCSRQVHFKVWFLFLSIGQNTTVFSLVVSCFWMFRKSRISRASEQQRALLVDIERTDPRGWNLKVCVVFQQGRWHCELWTVGICIAINSSLRQYCWKVVSFRISYYEHSARSTPISGAVSGFFYVVAHCELCFLHSISYLLGQSETLFLSIIIPAPQAFRSSLERTANSKIWPIRQWGGKGNSNP